MKVHFKNADGELDFTPAALQGGRYGSGLRVDLRRHFHVSAPPRRRGVTPRLTIPSPTSSTTAAARPRWIARSTRRSKNSGRPDRGHPRPIGRVHDIGCPLQFDDTSLAYLDDPTSAGRSPTAARTPSASTRPTSAASTRRSTVAPEGLRVTTHVCRSNSVTISRRGRLRVCRGGGFFNELGVDGFFLEYDDERSGGFEPLRHVPKDRLSSSASSPPARRARVQGRPRGPARRRREVCRPRPGLISPQSGFSWTFEGNSLSVDQEKAKLALLVELADESGLAPTRRPRLRRPRAVMHQPQSSSRCLGAVAVRRPRVEPLDSSQTPSARTPGLRRQHQPRAGRPACGARIPLARTGPARRTVRLSRR